MGTNEGIIPPISTGRNGRRPSMLPGSPVTRCAAVWPRRAARNGASERSIMKQTGHRSVQMVRRYIHDAELFNDNAGAKLGL
jgi:hypothetical protein